MSANEEVREIFQQDISPEAQRRRLDEYLLRRATAKTASGERRKYPTLQGEHESAGHRTGEIDLG